MVKSGLSGQYGLIPQNDIRKKYEITSGYENPNHTEDYWRTTLKDLKPDAPFMESDQIRRDNHSEERILLRTEGHRSGATPDHSEMFLELTEREPRGTSTDPDFSKYREQAFSRKDYYRFYPDNDDSVTDWQSTPITQQRNRVNTFYDVKKRLKIFSTSKDSHMVSRNFQHATESNLDLTAGQLPLISIPESVFGESEDRTSTKSNSTRIGWHRTTDHDFSVAQYGAAPVALKPTRSEINRNQQTPDSFMEEIFSDQRVNSGLAVLMQDIMKEREVQRLAIPSQQMHIARQIDVYKKMFQKPTTTDISRTEITQEISRLQGLMHELSNLGTANAMQNNIHNVIANTQNSRNKIQIDKEQLANSMTGAIVNPGNRKHTRRAIMELMSGKVATPHEDLLRQHKEYFVKNNGQRKSHQTSQLSDSLKTINLSGLLPVSSLASNERMGNMHKYSMASTEEYAKEGLDSMLRDSNANARAGRTANDATQDTSGWNVLEGATKDRSVKGMSSKYTNDLLDSDHKDLNVMADM